MFGYNGNRSIICNNVVWILVISLLLFSKLIVCSNEHTSGIPKSEVANKTDNFNNKNNNNIISLQFRLGLRLFPQTQVEDKGVIKGDGFVEDQIVDNVYEKDRAGSNLSTTGLTGLSSATTLSESVLERTSIRPNPSRPMAIRRNKRNAKQKSGKKRRNKRNTREFVTVKKVFPVKVKIETDVPVNGDKLEKKLETKKVKEIEKEVKSLLEHGDPCLTSPCRNKAVCEKVGDKKYKCICPKGYQGRHCESKINVIVISAEEKLSNDESDSGLVLTISLSICIPLGLIFLFLSIHFIRIQIRRSELVGQYEQEITAGLLPENLPPDYRTISNTLCEEVFCSCQKPKYTVDDIVNELERVATTEQLNNMVKRVSSQSVERVATTEQLNNMVERVSSLPVERVSSLSVERVATREQLNNMVERVLSLQ